MSDTADSNSIPPVKQCSKCGVYYPATKEWFNLDAGKLRANCKACVHAYKVQYYAKNADKVKAKSRQYNIEHADRIKERGEQYRLEHAELLKEKSRKYYAQNIDKRNDWQREYNRRNADRVKATKREYHIRTIDRVRVLQRKYSITHAEKVQGYKRKYAINNASKINVANHQRRALRKALPATLTTEQWQRAQDYFGGCCAACGRPRGLWHTIAQDHWIPLSKGGAYSATNIIPLCHGTGGCNNSKRDIDAHQWLIKTFGARKAKQIETRIQEYFNWVRERDSDDEGNT